MRRHRFGLARRASRALAALVVLPLVGMAQPPAAPDSLKPGGAPFASPAGASGEVGCEVPAYCERWQTSSITSYGAVEATRPALVRAVIDTLVLPPMQVPWVGRITTYFGAAHNGWDIDLDLGDTVRVALDGRVRYVGYDARGFGNVVVIRHPSGVETLYAHLQRPLVTPTQAVRAGEPVGLGGSTGRSTGPHLHFEVRLWDLPLDPWPYIGEAMGVTERPARSGRTPGGAGRTVVVRPGETLSGLAKRHRTTVERLRRLNGLRPGQPLRAGRTLRVR